MDYEDLMDEERDQREEMRRTRLGLERCENCGDYVDNYGREVFDDEYFCLACLAMPHCSDLHWEVERLQGNRWVCLVPDCTETPFELQ